MEYFTVKICILGDSNVGKSCIAVRFVDNSFGLPLPNTIGASFTWKNVETKAGTLYKLQIWDTVGQERYKALAPLYYRGAAVVFIVYDVTDRDSFVNGVRDWVGQMDAHCDPDEILLVLIGNKVDLSSVREVNEKEAREYASNIGATYWETSAKTGFNIDKVFLDVCLRLEEQGNKHLIYVSDRAFSRERAITVTSSSGESVKQKHVKISSRCCG